MSRSLDNQLSYSGGEFSPLMDARVDHPKYTSGCRQLQNMIALKHGGATRRPGTIYVATAKYQDTDIRQYASRLMRFQFSPTTSFILEFGHQYIRFYSNKQQVVLASAPGWVAATPYVAGDFVEDPGAGGAIYYCMADVTGAIQPNLDPAHWVQQSIYEVPTPFNGREFYGPSIFEIDIWRIVPCQINDVIYLVHPNYPPYKLERFGDTDWRLSQVVFLTPALLDPNPTNLYLGPSATTGNIVINANAPAWAAATYYDVGRSVNSGQLYTCIVAHVAGTFATDLANGYWRLETVFNTGNVGGYWQLGWVRDAASKSIAITGNGSSTSIEATGNCEFATYGTWAADVDLERSDDFGATWQKIRTISGASDHNGNIAVIIQGTAFFRLTVRNWVSSTGAPRAVFTIPSAAVYGLVKVTGYNSNTQIQAVVVSKLPSTNTTTLWSEGAWSGRRGYPQAVTAFQNRMVYGGSAYEPQRIWGTVTDDLENFNRGDQTLATDSFAFDLAAVGRGRIQWLIGQVDLFCGFSGAEWIINAGQGSFGGSNEPVTPQQINAGEHSSWGSAPGVPPLLVGNNVLYPQRSARTLQQMMFSVYTNKYQSADITSLSEHLFGSGIVQMAYQPNFRSQSMVWAATAGGGLMGMTYDTQTEVFAWHRHISGYDSVNNTVHFFESVACIDGLEDEDDQVWVVCDRPGGRMIELINPGNWETAGTPRRGIPTTRLEQAIYVDSAVTYQQPFVPSTTIPGLNHLVGLYVIALIKGLFVTPVPLLVQPDGTVVIEFDFQYGDLVQIGLPMDYAAQGMRMDVDGRAGILIGVTKALSRVYLRLFNSLSGRVKGNGNKLVPIVYRLQTTPVGQIGPLTTGQKDVVPESTQTYDPEMVIQGNDPLPLTLLATTVRMDISGSA